MTALANLKLVNAKRPVHLSPVVQRRNNVAKRIFEQIELAKSKLEGKAFSPTRLRTVSGSVGCSGVPNSSEISAMALTQPSNCS